MVPINNLCTGMRLQAIFWPRGESTEKGRNGVTDIIVVEENGQNGYVPWAYVKRTGWPDQMFNLALVEGVNIEPTADQTTGLSTSTREAISAAVPMGQCACCKATLMVFHPHYQINVTNIDDPNDKRGKNFFLCQACFKFHECAAIEEDKPDLTTANPAATLPGTRCSRCLRQIDPGTSRMLIGDSIKVPWCLECYKNHGGGE